MMIEEPGFTLLALNYLGIAAFFVYCYARPQNWSLWIVRNSRSFMAFYVVNVFVVWLSMKFIEEFQQDILLALLGLVSMFVLIGIFRKDLFGTGWISVIPLFLVLLSFSQEYLHAFWSGDSSYFALLNYWYVLGVFFMLVSGFIISHLLRLAFPGLEDDHFRTLKKQLKPEELKKLRLDNEVDVVMGGRFAESAAVGISYAIWMVCRYPLLGYFF